MSPGRRIIVEVRGGDLSGAKAIIAPGEALRIGRTERAHLIIPGDANLSPIHCELTWNGATCLLRDAGSAGGTWLQGARVRGAVEVPHAASIQAGGSSFLVHCEAFSPAPAPLPPALARAAAEARAALATRLGRLYAVLDAARDARILTLLRESVDPTRSLHDIADGEAPAGVAPTLVSFRRDSGLLDRLLGEGWGRGWGVFVTSAASFAAVRRHLRRFLPVAGDDGGPSLRFHDPRALREHLRRATPQQRADLFAGLDTFLLEGEEGELLDFAAPPPRAPSRP